MKLTLEQKDLIEALNKANGVVERRNTMAILGNVLLSASDGELSVTATDLDIEVTSSTQATVDTQGSVTVPYGTLHGIVSKLKKGALVSLELIDGFLAVESGKSQFSLHTLPSDDFPTMNNNSEFARSSTVDADVLATMLSRVQFAMSNEETRYYLNGVYMHNSDTGDLVTVATDGHRLAKMQKDINVDVTPCIIPRKAIGLIPKILTTGDVVFSTSETMFKISGDGFSVSGKVIDGTFPDYTRVIPQGNTKRAVIDAKEFNGAIGRVTPLADTRDRSVKLSLADGACSFSVKSGAGNANDEIEAAYSDDPLDIGFNSKYLLEVAAQAENGNLDIMFGRDTDPALIKPDAYDGLICVVMPTRI